MRGNTTAEDQALDQEQLALAPIVGEDVARHLQYYGALPPLDPSHGVTRKTFVFDFDDEGQVALDLSDTSVPRSLHYGAVLYAIMKADFSVTLDELRREGFVPFEQGFQKLDGTGVVPSSIEHSLLL
jgi:hypothetical protein